MTGKFAAARAHRDTAGPVTVGAAGRQPQQTLAGIVAPLIRAVPLQALETLDREMRRLSDHLAVARAADLDSRALAPIQQGLDDARAVLKQLRPRESLAAFHAATDAFTARLSRPHAHPHDATRAQMDAVITTLRDVGRLVASKDILISLSDEMRGLSATLQRLVARRNAGVSEPPPLPPTDPAPSAIEERLAEITRRLDALQDNARPSQETAATPDRRAHDALEAVHATLSQLVAQLNGDLKSGSREPVSLSGGHDTGTRGLIDFASQSDANVALAGLHDSAGYRPAAAEFEPEPKRRTLVIPVRPLIFGVVVVVLASVAARVSMQFTQMQPLSVVLSGDARAPQADAEDADIRLGMSDHEIPDLVRSQSPAAPPLPPDRPVQQAMAESEPEVTGSIGRPAPLPAGSGETAREPSLPLPDGLPSQLRVEAAKGKAPAEYEVGVRLVEGKSVPVNVEEGLRWLRRAAKAGVVPAHLWLGSLYEKGLGVEKDLGIARMHYTHAAEKGNAKAMHNLAVLYAEGIDGRRDYKMAVRWFQRAAERGIADSQYNLGILTMRGIGTDQNHQDAYKWFSLAALQGDREAARHRDEIGPKLAPGALATAKSAIQTFAPKQQPNDAVVVATPPGGWDRPAGNAAGGRRSQSGIFARGAS